MWLRRIRDRLFGRVHAFILHHLFKIRIRSWFELDIRRGDGSLELYRFNNQVTNAGLAWLTAKLAGGATDIEYVAAGDAADGVDPLDTALQGNELARVAGTPSQETGLITDDTYQIESEFGVGVGTGTWEEIGVFDADADGTMFARALTGTKTKGAGDIFTARHKTQFARPA